MRAICPPYELVFVPVDLTPDQKGGIAELAIAAKASMLGIVVSRPMAEGSRYDLVFDWQHGLQRVQCKWAREVGETVVVRPYSCRRTASSQLIRGYSSDDVDVIAAYCLTLDEVWVIPISDVGSRRNIHLRLAPAKNNQQSGVTMAAPYRLGAIAQLGERLAGSQKVAGSSPAGSIACRRSHESAEADS